MNLAKFNYLKYTSYVILSVIVIQILVFLTSVTGVFTGNITSKVTEFTDFMAKLNSLSSLVSAELQPIFDTITNTVDTAQTTYQIFTITMSSGLLFVGLLGAGILSAIIKKVRNNSNSVMSLIVGALIVIGLINMTYFSSFASFLRLLLGFNLVVLLLNSLLFVLYILVLTAIVTKFVIVLKNHEYQSKLFLKDIANFLLILIIVILSFLVLQILVILGGINVLLNNIHLAQDYNVSNAVINFLITQFSTLINYEIPMPQLAAPILNNFDKTIDQVFINFFKNIINNYYYKFLNKDLIYIVVSGVGLVFLSRVEKNPFNKIEFIVYAVSMILISVILMFVNPFVLANVIGLVLAIIITVHIFDNLKNFKVKGEKND